MNWKNRLKGKNLEALNKEESTEALTKRRDDLWIKTGQHQFTKAVLEAELLQFNQEILNINNKLQKKFQKATPKPKIAPAPAERIVENPEVLPAESAIQ